MPNTKTAWKNLRKSTRKAAINKPRKTQIKTNIKKILNVISEMSKPGIDPNLVISAISSFIGKVHSLSRKNGFDKLRARRIESKIVMRIRKLCEFQIPVAK